MLFLTREFLHVVFYEKSFLRLLLFFYISLLCLKNIEIQTHFLTQPLVIAKSTVTLIKT